MKEESLMAERVSSYERLHIPMNVWDITDQHTESHEYMRELSTRSGVDFQTILDDVYARYERDEGGIPHLEGTVDQEMCVNSYTFGAFEPTYFELLGAEGIRDLRKMDHPRFLLVGSFGRYSSEEFHSFSRKIHPNAEVFVVDIDAFQIPLYDQVRKEKDVIFSIADGKKVPFRENVFDVVCTNHLLHFLAGDCMTQSRTDAKTKEFVNEMHRVTKIGGDMLLVEQKYGYYKVNAVSRERQCDSFSRIVQSSFFENGSGGLKEMISGYYYAFRNDIGSVAISNDANPSFSEKSLILKDRDLFGARLKK